MIDHTKSTQFICTDPKKLVESIQEYQSKILYLVSLGEIKRKYVIFSNIGYGE